MANAHPRYLLLDGKLVPYADARVHVLSAAFKYGIIVFEGLRAYWNEAKGELYGFRFDDHFERLLRSLKVMRLASPLPAAAYTDAMVRLIRENELRTDLHLRAQVFVNEDDGRIGATAPVSFAMAAMPMERYHGKDGLSVQISSWTRISERDLPPRIKAVPNYHNSRLALLQAKLDGYDDAILLGPDGKVTEGPGYNLFMVRGGSLVTPSTTDGILEGITRDSILELARDMGVPTVERSIDRTELYLADEIFFCGSAAEVTPITSVDRHVVGSGGPGRVSLELRERFLSTARGERDDARAWLTRIYNPTPADRPPAAR